MIKGLLDKASLHRHSAYKFGIFSAVVKLSNVDNLLDVYLTEITYVCGYLHPRSTLYLQTERRDDGSL